MGLSLSKLEKVKRLGSNTLARCPACAEIGHDRKGEHLFIEPSGKFGCVVHPGQNGHKHRQRIFELAGDKSSDTGSFKIKEPLSSQQNVIQKNILGRLGHTLETHARKQLNSSYEQNKNQEGLTNSVPSVPERLPASFAPEELKMLQGINPESLAYIEDIKDAFNGTVIRVIDTNLIDLGKFQGEK